MTIYENTDELVVKVRLAAGQGIDPDNDPDRFEEVVDAIRDALEAGLTAGVNRARELLPDVEFRVEVDGDILAEEVNVR